MTRIEFYRPEGGISGRSGSAAWGRGWRGIDGKERLQKTGVPSKRFIFNCIQFLH